MTHAQTIIDSLVSNYVEQYALPEEALALVDRVRQRIVTSPNALEDARSLYGTQDCEDMALAMMWILENVGSDDDRVEPTEDERTAVHSGLTSALTRMGFLGEQTEEPGTLPGEGSFGGETTVDVLSVNDESPESDVRVEEAPEVSEYSGDASAMDAGPEGSEGPVSETAADDISATPEFSAEPETDTGNMEMGGDVSGGASPAGGTTDLAEIGTQLEHLLEALQSGADEREDLLNSLRASFAACMAAGETDASLQRYAETVDDFLGYVQANDLLDDVRVMNFFTNVQEPYAQWLEMGEGDREGVLEQAIDFLADFRAMFE